MFIKYCNYETSQNSMVYNFSSNLTTTIFQLSNDSLWLMAVCLSIFLLVFLMYSPISLGPR